MGFGSGPNAPWPKRAHDQSILGRNIAEAKAMFTQRQKKGFVNEPGPRR